MRSQQKGAALFSILALLALVRPGGANAEQLARDLIDAGIREAWHREQVTPAPPATDAVFLRRIYLDLLGTIPTYQEARAFLADDGADKRAKLIDRLLVDPRYAAHQSDVWDMILFGRNPPGYKTNERDHFRAWLRTQFQVNLPYDQLVDRLLRADGNSVDQGPPLYLAQWRRQPEEAAEAVSQTFLGVQLQCSRCHDHPFEDWTQRDFYGMAAFFARLEVVDVGKQDRFTKFAIGEKNLGDIMFAGPAAEQEPGKKGEPIEPRFLLGDALDEPELPEDFAEPRNFPGGKMPPKPQFSRKDKLAEWISRADNPFFARAVANRVWAQFMGRGLVHPVDNMSESNPASHPQLLKALSAALVEHQFDLKWYVRELVNSGTYQLGHEGEITEALPRWYQRARVRPLAAEELADAWRVATNLMAADKQAVERVPKDRFYPLTSGYMIRFFGTPNNGVGNFQGGLHEHLYLNNGQIGQLINYGEGGLHHVLLKSEASPDERVERLFLSILTRFPDEEEKQKFSEYLSSDQRPEDRIREAMWVLMTCSEFRFNH